MDRLRTFFNTLWGLLPDAGLASELHPTLHGGYLPIPFIGTQKRLLNEPPDNNHQPMVLQPPFISFYSYMKGYTSLPVRDRSLAALRSAQLCGARHLIPDITRRALDAGLQTSDIELALQGQLSRGWTSQETIVMQVAESLFFQQNINTEQWQQLHKIYKPQQILDLLFCCAAFHLCT